MYRIAQIETLGNSNRQAVSLLQLSKNYFLERAFTEY